MRNPVANHMMFLQVLIHRHQRLRLCSVGLCEKTENPGSDIRADASIFQFLNHEGAVNGAKCTAKVNEDCLCVNFGNQVKS